MGEADRNQTRASQRTKLLNKARALFWKKGFDATSIRDIASAFGCKPANVYNYFPNKESILFAIIMDEMELLLTPVIHLETSEEGDPVTHLKFFIRNHIEVALGYHRSSKVLFDSGLGSLTTAKRKQVIKLRDQYDRILCTIIRRGKKSGELADINERLATYAIASIIARSRLWYSERGEVSKEELTRFVIDFVMNGLRPRQDVLLN